MSLSAEQVEGYIDRISLPHTVRAWLRQGPNGPNALEAIIKLQQCHLAAIPFENLDLVYSSHHSIQTQTHLAYEHIVKRGRGGVCDSVHPLFARLLRFYGFLVYLTGSRINAAAGIVADSKLDKSKPSYGPWKRRMIFDSIPGWSDPGQKWWRMQIQYTDTHPWMDVWAFTETEWQEVDFQMLRSAYTALGTGWVTPRPVCFRTKFEDGVPVGYLLLAERELIQNYKGETKIVQRFFNENDRVTALAEAFDLHLTEEEQKQIVGYGAELKDEDFDYYA
ncbi:hypothetical protein SLS62_003537 [Diatrype stigma]|uniref:Arylamine N-acetyltransferase n=1 Tax=Diatrype stigma TaxID=117547 RepID=A0AAN9YTY0_9PEZI